MKINPKAKAIEIDNTEAPLYRVCTVDSDGSILDLADDFHDHQKARAFAEELSRKSLLPVRRRDHL